MITANGCAPASSKTGKLNVCPIGLIHSSASVLAGSVRSGCCADCLVRPRFGPLPTCTSRPDVQALPAGRHGLPAECAGGADLR
jgi:hypothetical protein